ncbi:MAG: T9SS type A sorting domain-containing protein [Marinoscillum sp.]
MKALSHLVVALLLFFTYELFAQSCPSDYNSTATVTSAMGSCSATGNPVYQGFGFSDETLTIEAGATLTITGDFAVYDDVIVYGTLIVTDDMEIVSGGSLWVAPGGMVDVGDDFTNGGYISSGSTGVDGTMVVGGDFTNRGTGTVNVGEDGSLQTGSFTNDGGTVNVAGGDTDCTTNGCCGDCAALPVVMVDLRASNTNGVALITWTTAQELDNHYFEILKLEESSEIFTTIGTVNGHGTTKESITYSFIDEDFNADSYYQIRQVDFDGESETFGPVALTTASKQDLIVDVYPNPTVSTIKISGNGFTGFSIHNLRGQLIRTENNRLTREAELIINNTLANAKGTFFLTFWNEEQKVVKRIVKR